MSMRFAIVAALVGKAAAFAFAPAAPSASRAGIAIASPSSLSMAPSASDSAAETFVKAWISGDRLDAAAYPPAPESVEGLYETHLAIQSHPLVESELGGLGGYKLGAIGAEGEACLYAPLFRGFFVESGEQMSVDAIHMSAVEAEFGIVMGSDLPPKSEPYTTEEVWGAVGDVVPCIECCGKRGTPEAYAASTKLGSFADTLSSGGIVLGPGIPKEDFNKEDLLGATSLLVNGELAAEGDGSKVPEEGPLEALTYLANHLNGRGLGLKKGQLVATGQTCATKAFKVGDDVTASFGKYGEAKMVVAV